MATMDAEEYEADFDDEAYMQEDWETQGANPEVVKAILRGKEKEMDAMEEFDIFDVIEKLPENAHLLSTRWHNEPRGLGDAEEWRG